ncbi:MAG: S8 family serine peptidase [Blastocatellia bacterium]
MTMNAVAAAVTRIADYAKELDAAVAQIADYVKELEEKTQEIGDDSIERAEWARRVHRDFLQLLVDTIDAFTKAENLLAESESDFMTAEWLHLMKYEWLRLRQMAFEMKKRAQVRAPATANDFRSAVIYLGERGTQKDLSFLRKVEDDPPKVEDGPPLDSQEAVDLLRQASERIIETASAAPARAKVSPLTETDSPARDTAMGGPENKDFQNPLAAGYNANVAAPSGARPEPHAIYKIFCPAEEQNDLPSGINKIEAYKSFVVGRAPEAVIEQIQFRYPVDPVPQVIADSPKEALMGHKVLRKREKVIRFRSPIKESWKQALINVGATILEPMGGAELLIDVPNDVALDKIKDIESVISVQDYMPQASLRFLTTETDEAAGPVPGGRFDSAHYSDAILPGILVARFFNSNYCNEGEKLLSEHDITILGHEGDDRLVIDLLSSIDISAILEAICSLPGLRSVEEKTLETPSNDQARRVICIGVVSGCDHVNPAPVPNLCLDGDGEFVAIADTGLDTGDLNTLHSDLRNRVLQIISYPVAASWQWGLTNVGADIGAADQYTGHGTHVAGSLIGSGDQAARHGLQQMIRGIAPAANLIFQSLEQVPQWNAFYQQRSAQNGTPLPGPKITYGIPDDLKDLFQPCYDAGVRIHCNSWGRPISDGYGDRSRQLDSFVWDHPEFLVVVAAGNGAVALNGRIEPMSVESPGTAKNCLTVGATENDRAGEFAETYANWSPARFANPPFNQDGMVDHVDDIAAFSGRGPCFGNARRKPDVVAPGTYVLSTRSSVLPPGVDGWGSFPPAPDHYMFNGGTSMATPLVTGCAALVRQFLRQYKGMPNPSAALVKAAIIHSARYRRYRHRHPDAFPWADHEQGWGRVDLKRLLKPDDRCTVQFFDDDAGFLESGDRRDFMVRVNDSSIPLRVTLVYTDYPGPRLINNLNLHVFSPSKRLYFIGNDFQQTGAIDSVNNTEGVFVIVPQPGVWTIRVVAEEIQVGPQYFALIVSGGISPV